MTTTDEKPAFGVYVHWPFCRSKCLYCDFASGVRDEVDPEEWSRAFLSELDHYVALVPGRKITSVYFGGGTPTLMPVTLMGALLDRMAKYWSFDEDAEITLEGNPSSFAAGRFADFRRVGVNRMSLGVQALDDVSLQMLGRRHTADEARRALEGAAAAFPRFSFDLMFGRPHQTVAAWEKELATALKMAAGHMSAYQLTLEPGTPFYEMHKKGVLPMPEADAVADMHKATQMMMTVAGLPPYEISNFARAGEECRHNLNYWEYGEYIGIGPGAHGRIVTRGQKWAAQSMKDPDEWLKEVKKVGEAVLPMEPLSSEQRAREMLLMGLRLTKGIKCARFREETGMALTDFVDAALLQKLQTAGYVELTENRFRATAAGRMRLNALLEKLAG